MKTRSTNTHGPGAAHIGFGMFGSRGPLLSPEDPAGGGSGANPTPPPTNQQPATPPAEQPKLFTQEEVNSLVGRARVEAREAAKKPATAPAPAPHSEEGAAGGGQLSLKQLQAQLDDQKLRGAFDKRAAKLGIDDDAADDLFELYRVQRPDDLGTWLDGKVKRFGLKPGTTNNPNPNPQLPPGTNVIPQPASSAQTPPISDKGAPAPGGANDFERSLLENPIGFSGVDRERLVAKYGEAKATQMWMDAARGKAASIRITK